MKEQMIPQSDLDISLKKKVESSEKLAVKVLKKKCKANEFLLET